MAWVTRGKHRYFYQSVRVGGRTTHRYLGSGREAEATAAEIQARQRQRRDQAEALQREEQSRTHAVAPLEDLCQLTDLLTRATLIGLGYHLHARSEWRKRRVADDHLDASQGVPGSSEEHPGAGSCR